MFQKKIYVKEFIKGDDGILHPEIIFPESKDIVPQDLQEDNSHFARLRIRNSITPSGRRTGN